MANKMKVLLHPRLYVNSVPANLKVIKDAVVKVEMRTDQDIPVTQVFDKINLDAKEEIEIEYAIPAKLKSMEIAITGNIKPMRGEKDIPISANHNIKIQDFAGENLFCSMYLRNTDQGYEVYMFGKNGEPKQGVKIELEFKRKFVKTTLLCTLFTDKFGKVFLGKLENIHSLVAKG